MTKFVAIEGGDGVGKNTISSLLVEKLSSQGFTARKIDFPQYSRTLSGRALGEFLSGRFEGVSVQTAAALYALDRFESLQMQNWNDCGFDYVVFDRYIASNVAYQSAKVPPENREAIERWILNLECNIYGLPKPDISVLLRLPHSKAMELIEKKQIRSYTDEKFDVHEADQGLQAKLRTIYDDLAYRKVLGPWKVVEVLSEGRFRPPHDIAQEALNSIFIST